MPKTLELSKKSLASKDGDPILCLYVNATSRIQTIQIRNVLNCPLERVVFPGQRLMFEAVPDAELEIQDDELVTKTIPCRQLQVATY